MEKGCIITAHIYCGGAAMTDETKEFNPEALKQHIARLEKRLTILENRTKFNDIALINAVDRIDHETLQKGIKDAKLITGWEEEIPQE